MVLLRKIHYYILEYYYRVGAPEILDCTNTKRSADITWSRLKNLYFGNSSSTSTDEIFSKNGIRNAKVYSDILFKSFIKGFP